MTPAEGEGECALCHRLAPDDELERVATARGERRYCDQCMSAAERIVDALAAPFLWAMGARRRGAD